MPNTPSAKKELRKREKLTRQNTAIKEIIKEEIRKVDELIEQQQQDEAKKHAQLIQKKVDKAAKTHTISKNKANRIKSRISKKINDTSKPQE